MPFAEVIGEIPERELLSGEQRLLSLSETEMISLGWASEKKKLMAVAKNSRSGMCDIYVVNMGVPNREHEQIELDWECEDWKGNRKNYEIASEQIKGFSVSDDGEFLAFSGELLAVFQNMGTYYALTSEPIEDKIVCTGADFSGNIGLSAFRKDLLKKRNAIFDDEEETNE